MRVVFSVGGEFRPKPASYSKKYVPNKSQAKTGEASNLSQFFKDLCKIRKERFDTSEGNLAADD